ncbi:sigma 54-interacting transcriptional regulator [Desulfospira joergensenii]|uniref:sigma 54-interacting transcriptional regulator n=1 Tax=Desulfospira joergensenii TaxID=53329 RepID=UPI000428E332|nr:sigma 54-interacting transcriptional regulator [Desulfospira joergensenii]
MEKVESQSLDQNTREIHLLITFLPPPISLDILCTVTGRPPVKILQALEALVQSGHLSRYMEKGAGYYYLPDFKASRDRLREIPESILSETANQAISGICEHMPDNARKWLSLAHVYHISGLPVKHFKEMVKAGHYCLDLNLSVDAALYYRMALESISTTQMNYLEYEDQKNYIDAAIGLCICKDYALSPHIQRTFLNRALRLSESVDDPVREIRLRVLMAKSYMKTVKNEEAAKFLEAAWQMLSEYDFPAEVKLQVAMVNSELFFWQGHIDKAIDRYESVIGSHEELPSDVETLKSYIKLGWTYGVAGETARGIGLIRGVRKKAREMKAQELERYATLVIVIVLSDAGRIDEGEVFLKEIFETPEERLDNYILWPGNGKRAYFAYCRGDYENAFKYQDLAWQNSKALGTPHHRGPDNIEIMLGLEEMGMVHPEWNFEYDINRLMNWPDIYMQGVAYRFRALKAFRGKGSSESVEADLKKSISLLTQSGARIELSHALVLMARVRIEEKKIPVAEKLLKRAWEVFSKVNPDLFPKDLKPYLDRSSKNALWVESLLEVGDALSSTRNRNELLGRIIRQAMRIAGAERGAIFLRQDQDLEMVASRNLAPSEISPRAFAGQMSLIEEVFGSGTEIVKKAEVCQPSEVGKYSSMGWTGCFPIRMKTRVLGVIFMDRGPTRLQLPEDEISLLRIISNQAAVALENMEAYEEIIDLKSELEAETHFYRESFEPGLFKSQMIGRSEPFKKMLNLISKVAKSDSTVMITGETGVGKDMVAQAIHQHSNRSSGPFIAVNVVSLSPELIASELFGHEKGAFTGASQTRKGRFELASRGTLFLDDIDAFSPDIQAKMLRVLETKEFERVGGAHTLKTRFRLIAASNRDIEDLVEQKLFRSDFYYRLNVFPIRVPALRERAEDIPGLARYFMEMFAKKFKKQFDRISKNDMDALMNYHWPGNIRELRHVIERAVLLSRKGRLVIPPLDECLSAGMGEDSGKIISLREMEARHILKALDRCRGKVSGKGGAAELLELKPTTLYSKMKRLGIERDTFRMNSSNGEKGV